MFNKILCAVESLFPMLPAKTPFQVSQEGRRWCPDTVYYDLEPGRLDDPRYRQRIQALVRLDRELISFWRKREQKRQARLRLRSKLRACGLRVTGWDYPW